MHMNLLGHKYGKLTVVSGPVKQNGRIHWQCVCDCGREKLALAKTLRNKMTSSCGCLRKENNKKHGKSGTKEYYIWRNMLNRCFNVKLLCYVNYGGRGIKVCSEWLTFEKFYLDMGDCPKGMTLERVNNNLGYSKTNCIWATSKQQACNRRSTLLHKYKGKLLSMSAISELVGIKYGTLLARLRRGLSLKEAMRGSIQK